MTVSSFLPLPQISSYRHDRHKGDFEPPKTRATQHCRDLKLRVGISTHPAIQGGQYGDTPDAQELKTPLKVRPVSGRTAEIPYCPFGRDKQRHKSLHIFLFLPLIPSRQHRAQSQSIRLPCYCEFRICGTASRSPMQMRAMPAPLIPTKGVIE